MNFRAIELLAACNGQPKPAFMHPQLSYSGIETTFRPNDYGGTDRDASNPSGDGAYPHVTQSESMVWGHGSTIVVNYNDSRTAPSCYGGYSYSTDGGATWTRPGGGTGSSPICSGHGTNYGDPIVVYNEHLSSWFLGDLATGCGGQGIGLWTSTDGQTFVTGACAHYGSQDDRESMWVDNNPASPYYGRMYISWNNFSAGQNIFVTYSDNGTTWSVPVQVQSSGFVRNVQMTGSPGSEGTAFVQGMNEGSGGLSNRTNVIYRSTDGGATWATITQGAPFAAAGDAVCSSQTYFAMVSPIWRHMGWGQPGVGPNHVVHYVYAGHGDAQDTGDIFYIRSTDNGSTWSSPMRLNTDDTTRTQWMPSLAVSSDGALIASWYDRRNTTNNDYEWYGRLSTDNGVSWQDDRPISDQVVSQPLQPDPNVQPCYAGDYNYHSADGNNAYMTWTDGRVLVGGNSQQDVFFDKQDLAIGTPTPTHTPCAPVPCTSTSTITPTFTRTPTFTPTSTITPCGTANNYVVSQASGTVVPGTTDIGNHCDDCVTSIALPYTYELYGIPYTNVAISSNGTLQFTTAHSSYGNTCLPAQGLGATIFAHWDDLRTDTPSSGIFTSVSGSPGNRVFNIEWRASYFTDGNTINFEARLYEGQNRFEIIFGQVGQFGTSATVGVQDSTSARFSIFECNTGVLNPGLMVVFAQFQCGSHTSTPTGTPPTATYTHTPTISTTATDTPIPTPICPLGWEIVSSPNVGTVRNDLWEVAAVSANDIWAVGYSSNGGNNSTFIIHWNGIEWSVVPSPNAGTNNELYGIAAVSANDVWAVGASASGNWKTLVLHWDGTQWSIVPSPNPTSTTIYLNAVAAVSANDVWAVGHYRGTGTYPYRTLIEHWDGTQWSIVPSPNVPNQSNALRALAVVSTNDIWAVGYISACCVFRTLIEHWDGTQWSVVSSPNIGPVSNLLQAVTAISTNDVWAVGWFEDSGRGTYSLAVHWDGTSWSAYPTPPGTIADQAIVAIGSDDVWAVGGGIMHWNGSVWNAVPSPPSPSGYNKFLGIAAVSSDDIWAVGCNARNGCGPVFVDNRSLIAHWRGDTCASPTNTPAPQGYLYGHLTWPGIPQPLFANEMTATLTLCSGGSNAYTGVVTADENANFEANTGLPNGSYTWKIKGRRYLASGGTLIISGGVATQEFGLQKPGDANDSNNVNALDFIILKTTFGSTTDLRADFDNDGNIAISDFNLLRGNFGLAGVGLTCP